MARLITAIFLLALLAIGIKSWILRRSCMLYAKFSYIRENRVLTGFVGETLYNSSHADCEIACVESSFCKSLNIEDEGERRCEMSTKSPSDKSDGVSLIAMHGWTFKSTNYQDYLVGRQCQRLEPCAPDHICMDSCQCPGYTCQKCRGIKAGLNCFAKQEGTALGMESGKIVDKQISASSSNNPHEFPVKARLNKDSQWCVGRHAINDYIRVDFRTRKLITGFAVQGHSNTDMWVTKYQIDYTEDRKVWKMYTEEGVVKTFQGSTSRDAVVKQDLVYYILAYSIKLREMAYHEYPCMRMEIYGLDDQPNPGIPLVYGQPLGMENKGIKDYQMSYSSCFKNATSAHLARLKGANGWCCDRVNAKLYWRVDFIRRKIITDIAMQGKNSDEKFFVKLYEMRYTEDSYTWKIYQENGTNMVFFGTNERMYEKIVKQKLLHPIRAFGIMIFPKEYHGKACMRIELYGEDDSEQPPKPNVCSTDERPLGMASGTILDTMITASDHPVNFLPSHARLNGDSAWCSSDNRSAPYLQVDLMEKMLVTAVAIQGKPSRGIYAKKFHVSYSADSPNPSPFIEIYDENDTKVKKAFTGNKYDIRKNRLEPPIEARLVRISPFECVGNRCCIRVELYGCKLLSTSG